MTQEFSESHIYTHYLNVVRELINVKLTVLHTLMLGLTKLYFSIIQGILTGSCLVTGAMPAGNTS